LILPLSFLLLRTLGEVSPEEDDGDEKDDYDDIFDAVGLKEVYITVEITHHHTSLSSVICLSPLTIILSPVPHCNKKYRQRDAAQR
jgi:hypothetical protein